MEQRHGRVSWTAYPLAHGGDRRYSRPAMRSVFIAVVTAAGLLLAAPAGAQSVSLAERAAAIDRVLTEREGFRVVVGHISRELGITVDTLREQRKDTGLGWGDLLIAHRLAREAKAPLDQVITDFRDGKSWEEVARGRKVDLDKLTAVIERSQVTVERRTEDRPPPHSSAGPVTAPPSGRGIPTPSKQY